MNIKSFTYKDNSVNWELESIAFNQLTLLVGASGVGKTKILKSILNLKKIATGKSLNGVEWIVEFTTKDGKQCKWSGKFEELNNYRLSLSAMKDNDTEQAKVEREQLYIDNHLIVDRDSAGIKLKGTPTVKLPHNESIISLLKEEDLIKDVFREFQQIIINDNMDAVLGSLVDDISKEDREKYNEIDLIRLSNKKIISKLYLSYTKNLDVFNKVKNAFIQVFPYVEDIMFQVLERPSGALGFVSIKEKDVGDWIHTLDISSGMFKTLIQIAELYLCADSSVILIDEFENSLGINCIDDLTSSILTAERNLQFIITSHHPYIINNIDQSNWKLITRKAGKVSAHNMDEFKLGKSKHQAFTQLINLDSYTEGVGV